MAVAGLQGGSAKHATGVPGQGTDKDLLRRRPGAVPAPDTAEAARHADLGPARGPVDRAHEPRRVHEGLQQHQRMMKACRPVPHQMACAQPQHPGPEIGHRAQEQEPGVVGHQMQSVVLVAQRPANPRVTRLALQRRRRKRRQRHALAAPRRAIPQRLPHLRRRPEVMMRPHHSTEPRVLLGQHRTERHLRKLHPVPAPMQPLFKDLYRNSSRKSTPKRIRLEIQEPQSEQKIRPVENRCAVAYYSSYPGIINRPRSDRNRAGGRFFHRVLSGVDFAARAGVTSGRGWRLRRGACALGGGNPR